MTMHVLEAISSVDGRYRNRYTEPLAKHFSEMALIRARILVEVEYLVFLSDTGGMPLRGFTDEECTLLRDIPVKFGLKEAESVKAIEKETNHDVKAVEIFLRNQLKDSSLADCLEWIHFALTSEDINNISYAIMLTGGVSELKLQLDKIHDWLDQWAERYSTLSMQARTHGQPASPTTLGKEMRVYAERLYPQMEQLSNYCLKVKLNGATGNYNAHYAAFPDQDWVSFTKEFVKYLNDRHNWQFKPNLYTTQIEPHDTYSELFAIIQRINTIIIDFCQDIWRYISDDWIGQTPKAGEVGSSTMPNKVNPIDFENAEGNAEVANGLFDVYNRVLPRSRLQRHLSDSTIIRTFGTAFGHTLVTYRSLLAGMDKIHPNQREMAADLDRRADVLAEAFQTILRSLNYPDPYSRLKDFSRGKQVTAEDFKNLAQSLDVDQSVKDRLISLTPQNYTGLASHLAKGNS